MSIQATSGNASIDMSAVAALKAAQSNAAQEATETAEITKQEAVKGDRQAIRKLARQQQLHPTPTPASPEGVGKSIDVKA